ncbi:hypothetical protein BJV78DRAFT_1156911 [Lactifluus subvellereus]|nr:hypothetical protein BJV78DRAFT_1156911 [Lactifluus subvellereus]
MPAYWLIGSTPLYYPHLRPLSNSASHIPLSLPSPVPVRSHAKPTSKRISKSPRKPTEPTATTQLAFLDNHGKYLFLPPPWRSFVLVLHTSPRSPGNSPHITAAPACIESIFPGGNEARLPSPTGRGCKNYVRYSKFLPGQAKTISGAVIPAPSIGYGKNGQGNVYVTLAADWPVTTRPPFRVPRISESATGPECTLPNRIDPPGCKGEP